MYVTRTFAKGKDSGDTTKKNKEDQSSLNNITVGEKRGA
jgi:hypothetical protein